MPDTQDIPSPRERRRASAKRVREARAAQRQVVFEALAAGWTIEQIADLRKISPHCSPRGRPRARRTAADAPDRYAHLQVARLTKALRLADAAIDEGKLQAIAPLVKVVRELDRYHGLERSDATPAARAVVQSLASPPLLLTRLAPPMAVPSIELTLPGPARSQPCCKRPRRGARSCGSPCPRAGARCRRKRFRDRFARPSRNCEGGARGARRFAKAAQRRDG